MQDRMTIENLFNVISKCSYRGFIYLSYEEVWTLDSHCIVVNELSNDELAEEMKPDGMEYVMGIDTMSMVLENATEQKSDATHEDLLEAFLFYFDNDAYIEFV